MNNDYDMRLLLRFVQALKDGRYNLLLNSKYNASISKLEKSFKLKQEELVKYKRIKLTNGVIWQPKNEDYDLPRNDQIINNSTFMIQKC